MDGLIEQIAQTCHEVNRAWCEINGDNSQKAWADAEQWQRDSALNGVLFCVNNPDSTPEQQHEQWMKVKREDGWVFGPVKNPGLKEHPCMLPYSQLPLEQRVKDVLFRAVVKSFL